MLTISRSTLIAALFATAALTACDAGGDYCYQVDGQIECVVDGADVDVVQSSGTDSITGVANTFELGQASVSRSSCVGSRCTQTTTQVDYSRNTTTGDETYTRQTTTCTGSGADQTCKTCTVSYNTVNGQVQDYEQHCE